MKLKPMDHPVAGRLLPDQWGDSLMCFRRISALKMFAPEHAKEVFEQLEPAERTLLESWRETPKELVENCRDMGLYTGLWSLGVCEVCFDKTAEATPSDEQIAALKYFQEHEESIGKNVANAMLRYYQIVRAADEGWFDNNDCPPAKTLEELGPLVTLDGLTFTRNSCEGQAVIVVTWDPEWDPEHGLSMVVWKDQVVGIGVEDVYDLAPDGPADFMMWNRSHMTDVEQAHLDKVIACLGEYEEDDEDDDFDEDDDE